MRVSLVTIIFMHFSSYYCPSEHVLLPSPAELVEKAATVVLFSSSESGVIAHLLVLACMYVCVPLVYARYRQRNWQVL
jgi:hypothetical protein